MVGSNPASKPGHPDDRWMVSFSAYPRESLAGQGAEVARRQADGTWKFVIDNLFAGSEG